MPPLPLRVAFAISEEANVIDLAGSWETYQDASMPATGKMSGAFELMTVAESRAVVTATGGLRIEPQHTFDDVPQPHVVVVGAQRGSPELLTWLRVQKERAEVITSVCIGAFHLGRAGLLDEKRATTHHDFYDDFAREFPKVDLVRGTRFVDEGSICTAGGLTSGIHLALHIVQRYLGSDTAKDVASFMEFDPR